jgi:uncharacterized protein YjbI with pentapeptide repeats
VLEHSNGRNVSLTDCRLRGLETKESRLTGMKLDSCTVEGWKDAGGVFKEPAFRLTSIGAPRWKGTRLSATRLEKVAFTGGALEDVWFMQNTANDLAFKKVSPDGLVLSFGEIRGIVFEEANGRSIAMNEGRVSGLRVVRSEIAGLALAAAEVDSLVIERCPMVSLLSVLAGNFGELRVVDSTLRASSIQESRISGKVMLERAVVQALDLRESTVAELVVRRCSVDGPLGIERARFGTIRLDEVRYGGSYRLLDSGAVIEHGDRFPKARP